MTAYEIDQEVIHSIIETARKRYKKWDRTEEEMKRLLHSKREIAENESSRQYFREKFDEELQELFTAMCKFSELLRCLDFWELDCEAKVNTTIRYQV